MKVLRILALIVTLMPSAGESQSDALQRAKKSAVTVGQDVTRGTGQFMDTTNAIMGDVRGCGQMNPNQLMAIDCALPRTKLGRMTNDQMLASQWGEQMVASELAESSRISIQCHLPFLDQYKKDNQENPPVGFAAQMNDKALAQFNESQLLISKMKERLDQAKIEREAARTRCGPISERPSYECARESGLKQEALSIEIKEISMGLAAEVGKIPYGSDPSMREELIQLSLKGQATPEKFRDVYARGILESRDHLVAFQSELNDARTNFDQENAVYDLTPALKQKLIISDAYAQTVEKMKIGQSLKDQLMCRRERQYVKGPKVTYALMAIGTAATFGAGAIVSGAMLVGDATMAYDTFSRSCLSRSTAIANPSSETGCDPLGGFNGVTQQTSNASCVSQALIGALPALAQFARYMVPLGGRAKQAAPAESRAVDRPPASASAKAEAASPPSSVVSSRVEGPTSLADSYQRMKQGLGYEPVVRDANLKQQKFNAYQNGFTENPGRVTYRGNTAILRDQTFVRHEVADQSNSVVGSLTYSKNKDGTSLRIYNMETRSEDQRKSVGEFLFQKAVSENPKAKSILSYMDEDNYKVLKAAMDSGMSCVDAIRMTPAYKIRVRAGFPTITQSACATGGGRIYESGNVSFTVSR